MQALIYIYNIYIYMYIYNIYYKECKPKECKPWGLNKKTRQAVEAEEVSSCSSR